MGIKLTVFIIVLLFAFGYVGCRKVEPIIPPAGQLEKVTLDNLSGIPLEYGKLVGVTAHAQYEGWAQLWFVDDLQTVRMVRVQFHVNRIHENVLVIPRY